MKWSTLILIVVALVSVVGVAFFVFPWGWADDVQQGWDCADTSYEYYETGGLSTQIWWDPDTTVYRDRRIVHLYGTVDDVDWGYVDNTIGFAVQSNTAANLRELVKAGHDSPSKWVSDESWHWFDCTICITQGECGGTKSDVAPDDWSIEHHVYPVEP